MIQYEDVKLFVETSNEAAFESGDPQEHAKLESESLGIDFDDVSAGLAKDAGPIGAAILGGIVIGLALHDKAVQR